MNIHGHPPLLHHTPLVVFLLVFLLRVLLVAQYCNPPSRLQGIAIPIALVFFRSCKALRYNPLHFECRRSTLRSEARMQAAQQGGHNGGHKGGHRISCWPLEGSAAIRGYRSCSIAYRNLMGH